MMQRLIDSQVLRFMACTWVGEFVLPLPPRITTKRALAVETAVCFYITVVAVKGVHMEEKPIELAGLITGCYAPKPPTRMTLIAW